jgi:bacterioferritin-associated ferredoxin
VPSGWSSSAAPSSSVEALSSCGTCGEAARASLRSAKASRRSAAKVAGSEAERGSFSAHGSPRHAAEKTSQ